MIEDNNKKVSDRQLICEGISASSGVCCAPCQVVFGYDPSFIPGNILVISHTDPTVMPNLLVAAGVITERGGRLSHAAIVTRELGIPCVIGAKDATTRLTTGDTIFLDADNGKIYVICHT